MSNNLNTKRLFKNLFILYMIPWTIILVILIITLVCTIADTHKILANVTTLENKVVEYEIEIEELTNKLDSLNKSTIEIPVYEEVEPRVATRIFKEVDDDELELLTNLIAAEAGSDYCSDTLQAYVASVILNRMESDLYPNTMEEVIFQDGQYACAKNGVIVWNYDERVYLRAKSMAKWILSTGSELPSNVVFQAQFEQGDGVYVKEEIYTGGYMYFCYKD